jgi:hypothetical protein
MFMQGVKLVSEANYLGTMLRPLRVGKNNQPFHDNRDKNGRTGICLAFSGIMCYLFIGIADIFKGMCLTFSWLFDLVKKRYIKF